jgi:hypothetical protein
MLAIIQFRIFCFPVYIKTQRLIYTELHYYYETSLSNGDHSCFISGRSSAEISAWRPIILTEDFHGLPQSLQTNAGIVLKIRP